MAGYRPKSLEELNSLYDKSLNLKNEIDKKASDLEIRQEIYTPVAPVVPEAQDVQQETSEAPAQEITGLVDDFIKNFSAEPVKRVRPVAPTTLKTVSSAKKEDARSPVMQGAPVQGVPSATHDKPRLIRNSERNDLFENYKKVMDDEDDEEYSRHRLGRKRSKKLFEKKAAAQEEVQTPENEAATESYDTDGQAVIEPDENEIPENLENIDAVIEKVLGKSGEAPAQQEAHQQEEADPACEAEDIAEEGAEPAYGEQITEEAAEEAAEVYEEQETQEPDGEKEQENSEALYESPEQEPAEQETAEQDVETAIESAGEETVFVPVKKSSAGKNVLLCVLLLVLLLATAVSAVKAFAGINSDSLVLEKYHLYTATESYAQARIKKGDLVVVAHEGIKEGDIFAFKKDKGEYDFAQLEGILNDDSVIADKDGQKSIVFKNTLRGVIYKVYPAIGTVAALIAANYLYITGALLAVALVLILVIIFAFRKKKEKQDLQEPDEAQPQTQETDNEQYDDVEGDFRYLIQDDSEDDFDVYRNSSDDEEGLPVYQPDDYKYEPDEYVNN